MVDVSLGKQSKGSVTVGLQKMPMPVIEHLHLQFNVARTPDPERIHPVVLAIASAVVGIALYRLRGF